MGNHEEYRSKHASSRDYKEREESKKQKRIGDNRMRTKIKAPGAETYPCPCPGPIPVPTPTYPPRA
jgi:hypothetical protein